MNYHTKSKSKSKLKSKSKPTLKVKSEKKNFPKEKYVNNGNFIKIKSNKNGKNAILEIWEYKNEIQIGLFIFIKGQKRVVNFKFANKFNCYTHKNNIELIENYFYDIEQLPHDVYEQENINISHFDKLIAIYFHQLRMLVYYSSLISNIIDNFQVVKTNIQERRTYRDESYYNLCISGFKYNLANLSIHKEKLHELYTDDRESIVSSSD